MVTLRWSSVRGSNGNMARYSHLTRVPSYIVAMNDRRNGRLVYSTDKGRVCPGCGWPVRDCRCSTRAAAEPVPSRSGKIVAKLRMEKKGRGGKTVTVVAGLPRNAAFLRELCQELKRACGTGGAVSEDTIELQGDLRDRIREYLLNKEFIVKG
jgi:translation initiation factor 1